MQTKVVAHTVIEPILQQWWVTLGKTPEERNKEYRQRWGDFESRIKEAKGPPAGSIPNLATRPPTYFCGFDGGFAEIVVEPDERTGWFSTMRRVVVINLLIPGLGE